MLTPSFACTAHAMPRACLGCCCYCWSRWLACCLRWQPIFRLITIRHHRCGVGISSGFLVPFVVLKPWVAVVLLMALVSGARVAVVSTPMAGGRLAGANVCRATSAVVRCPLLLFVLVDVVWPHSCRGLLMSVAVAVCSYSCRPRV